MSMSLPATAVTSVNPNHGDQGTHTEDLVLTSEPESIPGIVITPTEADELEECQPVLSGTEKGAKFYLPSTLDDDTDTNSDASSINSSLLDPREHDYPPRSSMNSPMPPRIRNPLPRHVAVMRNSDFHRSRYRQVLEMSPRSLQFQRDSERERKVTVPPVVRNMGMRIRTAPMPKMSSMRRRVVAQGAEDGRAVGQDDEKAEVRRVAARADFD